jgi:DNA-binding transcriptional LysR family regulator
MDKLAAMRTFVRIVEKGSLTAAANALETSQPTVVRILASLERELGVTLLNRTTRRIHLTEEGARYLERCAVILSAVQEAEEALTSGRKELRGNLTISASVLFGRRYVAPIVNDFLRRHPNITADLRFSDRIVNLIEEGVDVAVRIAHLRDASLVAVPVGQVRRVVCANGQYLRRNGIPQTPDDVREHRCIRHTGLTPRPEWHFKVGGRPVSVPIVSVMSCNEIDSSLNACIAGLGLGMFLSYQVASYRRNKQLVYVLEQFEPEPIPVHVIYPRLTLISNRVRALVDGCVDKLRHVKFD